MICQHSREVHNRCLMESFDLLCSYFTQFHCSLREFEINTYDAAIIATKYNLIDLEKTINRIFSNAVKQRDIVRITNIPNELISEINGSNMFDFRRIIFECDDEHQYSMIKISIEYDRIYNNGQTSMPYDVIKHNKTELFPKICNLCNIEQIQIYKNYYKDSIIFNYKSINRGKVTRIININTWNYGYEITLHLLNNSLVEFDTDILNMIFNTALQSNQSKVIKSVMLRNPKQNITSDIIEYAINKNFFNVVRYLLRHRDKHNKGFLSYYLGIGKIDYIKLYNLPLSPTMFAVFYSFLETNPYYYHCQLFMKNEQLVIDVNIIIIQKLLNLFREHDIVNTYKWSNLTLL